MVAKAFELIFFILPVLVVIKVAASWSPRRLHQIIYDQTAETHLLYACGSYKAGLNNLRDALEAASKKDQPNLKKAFHTLKSQWQTWETSGELPRNSDCIIESSTGSFEAAPFRLNQVDQPTRILNWSYRIRPVNIGPCDRSGSHCPSTKGN